MMKFGKYRGKSVEYLVLKEPDYVAWMLGQPDATGMLAEARREAIRLIQMFNNKPILTPCAGCQGETTRWSLYKGAVNPYPWCDDCDPTDRNPTPGKLTLIKSYMEALGYVSSWCGGCKTVLKTLINQMASAKGLPDRVGESQARAFFR